MAERARLDPTLPTWSLPGLYVHHVMYRGQEVCIAERAGNKRGREGRISIDVLIVDSKICRALLVMVHILLLVLDESLCCA